MFAKSDIQLCYEPKCNKATPVTDWVFERQTENTSHVYIFNIETFLLQKESYFDWYKEKNSQWVCERVSDWANKNQIHRKHRS